MRSNQSKKILFILYSLDAGGAENYALRFIQFAKRVNLTFHVLSPNLSKGDLHDEFALQNCIIHYQKISYANPLKFYQLFRLLKKEQFDVICTFNGNFGGFPHTIARLAGVKKRIALHRRSTNAFGSHPLKRLYNQMVNRLIRYNATTILSNSRFAFDNFYANYWEKDQRFSIIRNGLDTALYRKHIDKKEARQQLGLSQDTFLIGHVGRYDKAKNHTTIFKVANKLKDKIPNVRFVFAGKDTDSPVFQQKLEEYNITSLVLSYGLIKDVPLFYKSMDLFLFPSVTEGQPNALLEAMASGLPIITSNIPPILEVLPDILSSKMPDPLDHNAFAEIIKELYDSPQKQVEYTFRKYAIENFDGQVNFNLFLDKLVSNEEE